MLEGILGTFFLLMGIIGMKIEIIAVSALFMIASQIYYLGRRN